MELRGRIARARIVSLTDISGSFGRSKPLGGSFVAGQLAGNATTGGEVEEVARIGGITEVPVLIGEVGALASWKPETPSSDSHLRTTTAQKYTAGEEPSACCRRENLAW